MEVLLISPMDPKVPGDLKFLMGGENTFTRSMLDNPPEGIKYTFFQDALNRKEIVYTVWQKIFANLIRFRILPLDPGYHCIKLNKKFDLIHCHAYSLKLDGDIKPQVVLGDSSSNFLFLRDYLNWPLWRIRLQYLMRRFLHKRFLIFDRELNIDECKKLVVFSEFAKKIHVMLGADSKKVDVVYPGIFSFKRVRTAPTDRKINILFAGVWFERKGGHILLKAFEVLKKKYANIHLTLLSLLPKNTIIDRGRITQLDFVSYERLMSEFYPAADIFVLVPPVAEGFGMVTVEAMSFGIPVIVSDVYALPEIVENGKTGFVVKRGSVDDLVIALDKLIKNEKLRKEMGEAGKERFNKMFTSGVMNNKLLNVYRF